MKQELVTIRQAIALQRLGYGNTDTARRYRRYTAGKKDLEAVIPTVDEAIDWLRRKFNIIIANSYIPFVDPIHKRITYGFEVKKCNLRDGWNGRKILGYAKNGFNVYAVKRSAIQIAIRYIEKEQETTKTKKNDSKKGKN